MTQFSGDVIAAESPAGTGMSRTVRTEQVFLNDRDKIVATIDGMGTLRGTARRPIPGRAAETPKEVAQ